VLTDWNGREVTPKLGSFVWPDEWELGSHLSESDWSEAPFRIHASRVDLHLACKVEVTGRMIRRIPKTWDAYGVRVKVTFVQDDEADQTTGGWLFLYS
jgi:hypothetical protein